MSLLDDINAAIDALPQPEAEGSTQESKPKTQKYSPEFEEFAGKEEA